MFGSSKQVDMEVQWLPQPREEASFDSSSAEGPIGENDAAPELFALGLGKKTIYERKGS
jgi:hypothetical protein